MILAQAKMREENKKQDSDDSDAYGDEVDRYISDHIEDVVIEALGNCSDEFRRLVAKALSEIADNSSY